MRRCRPAFIFAFVVVAALAMQVPEYTPEPHAISANYLSEFVGPLAVYAQTGNTECFGQGQTVSVSMLTPGTDVIVAASGNKSVYVCAFGLTAQTTAGSGQNVIAGSYTVAAGFTAIATLLTGDTSSTLGGGTRVAVASTQPIFRTAQAKGLALRTTGSQAVTGWLTYSQR